MGRALAGSGSNPALQVNRDLTFTRGKYTYRIETHGAVSTYTVSDGARAIALPIEWTFGAEAQTYLLKRDGVFIESLVSYYPETGGLDVTLGDGDLNPGTLEEAIGRPQPEAGVVACFGCHSADSAVDHKLNLESLKPGVTCERCHEGSAGHAISIAARGGSKQIPEKIGARSAEAISNFCGQCHRSWETVVRNNWRGPVNVRFQPYRSARSQCFDGADARISCVACHDPHQNLVTSEVSYDAKCLSCHAAASAKHCTVSQSRCVSCHMPKVPLPGGHQTFTDHYIRVVKAGEVYPD